MSSTKPPSSSTSRPPKPPTTISPSAIISDGASLTGIHPITIGENSVVHPRAKLSLTHAPITIGRNCIIYERCLLGLSSPIASTGASGPGGSEQQQMVELDDSVVIETGAKVEACRIGEGTSIGINARIGRGAVIGSSCKIGPRCEIMDGEVVPDGTIVYGNGQRRVDHHSLVQAEADARGRQIEVLRGLIPSNLAKWRS